ncbi:hypothetical protein [Nodosilinea sp. E11]|uniref:hypothetical protein n=1 Tax=Nodosilinea sp. E11 TaxID=3037479 RepID=UPI0029352022|nr:hypothetical protein [Nodosilinea sp. E11]WOD39750.1 hypothetical protein RRF56_02940 [Nodosilinea sp. E11]
MQTILTTPPSVTPSVQNTSATLKDYVPLFQSLVWSIFWLLIFLLFRRQVIELLDVLREQLKKGASFKVGVLELSSSNVVEKTADLGDKVETAGRPDRLQLLFKAQGVSKGRFFIKSTKAMKVPGGCVVQVTSEIQNPDKTWSIAESLTFVPGDVVIKDDTDSEDKKSGHFLDNSNHSAGLEQV